MQGSLDRPPIVIASRRGRAWLLLGASAAFVLIGVTILAAGDPKGAVIGWLSIIFFGLGGAVALLMVIRPSRLELSADGIHLFTLGRHRLIAWGQAANFRVAVVPHMRLIGFDYVKADGTESSLGGLNQALGGAAGALPGGWEIKDAQLIALLNQSREHWISGVAAGLVTPPLPVGRTGDRIGRMPYWLGVAVMLALSYGVSLLPGAGRTVGAGLAGVWILLYGRRLHDLGRSAWWQGPLYGVQVAIIVALVIAHAGFEIAAGAAAILQLAFTAVLGAIPGQPDDNRFGAAPRKRAPPLVA